MSDTNRIIDYIRKAMGCDSNAIGFSNASVLTRKPDENTLNGQDKIIISKLNSSGYEEYIRSAETKVLNVKVVEYHVLPGGEPGYNPRDCYPHQVDVMGWLKAYPEVMDRMKINKPYNCDDLEELKDK